VWPACHSLYRSRSESPSFFFSFTSATRQTIAAYPKGAGSYTVAKENLGDKAGLLAAVALMIDYTLNVAVGI